MDDLLAGVEAAAGLAVYGGPPASARRDLIAAGAVGRSSGQDPGPTWIDAPRRARELLPQLAELAAELADLDEVVVARPATAASAMTRSLGVPLTVLALEPPRVRDAVADPDRLARTVAILTEGGDDLRPAFWPAHLAAGRTEAEASRHFVAVAEPGSALEATARELGIVVLPADPAGSGPFAAATLVPAALAGVDVAGLLDEAGRLAPSLAARDDNPALALAAAITWAPQPIRVRSDGTGFEGLDEWIAELLDGIVRIGEGGHTVSYGGALLPGSVPGGGVQPDIAVNGPLGAQFLAWQYVAAVGRAGN